MGRAGRAQDLRRVGRARQHLPGGTGAEVKFRGASTTISKAIRLGARRRAPRTAHVDPVGGHPVATERGIAPLIRGARSWMWRGAPPQASCGASRAIDGHGRLRGRQARAQRFQNECTVGRLDGNPFVTVPDLICVLDTESWRGDWQRDDPLWPTRHRDCPAVAAAAVLISPGGLSYVGPRAFRLRFRVQVRAARVAT